jgi:hypothetical protein
LSVLDYLLIYIYILKKKREEKSFIKQSHSFSNQANMSNARSIFCGTINATYHPYVSLVSPKMDVALKTTVGSKFNSDLL